MRTQRNFLRSNFFFMFLTKIMSSITNSCLHDQPQCHAKHKEHHDRCCWIRTCNPRKLCRHGHRRYQRVVRSWRPPPPGCPFHWTFGHLELVVGILRWCQWRWGFLWWNWLHWKLSADILREKLRFKDSEEKYFWHPNDALNWFTHSYGAIVWRCCCLLHWEWHWNRSVVVVLTNVTLELVMRS